jgi:uncharacterized protein (TIGR02646 family)
VIPIERRPEPEILKHKKAEWSVKFLAKRAENPKTRPDSSKYAHEDIVAVLRSMSHGKCYYCEAKPEDGTEVDHHVEVADDPSHAFTWENLYLSCGRCNHAKRGSKDILLTDCVDPCAAGSDPAQHLTFDDEQIRPRDGSERGRSTIRKYKLADPLLDLQRSKALRKLEQARSKLQDLRLAQGGRRLTEDERELLMSFALPERPFSLMLRVALRALEP